MPTSIFAQDILYASRLFRKSPAFTAAAICTLAVGIGANTAIFSVTDAVLLRPLPFSDSKRLVRIWQSEPQMGEGRLGAAPPEFAAYREQTRAFGRVAGYQPQDFDLTGRLQTEHISGYAVTASLFPTLEIKPFMGRNFTREEESPAAAKVVVLSYEFWRNRFAGDPNIVGSIVRLNEQPYAVIGVMPQGVTFPATAATPGQPPSFWTPLAFTTHQLNDWASSFDTSIVARLNPGISLAQAQQDVKRVAAQFQREHPDVYSGTVHLEATAEPWAPDFQAKARTTLRVLFAAVAFVLLIACVNVANLLLARAGARSVEMSLRRALGASAGRLTRQVLTETAILTLGGGALGGALAFALIRLTNAATIGEFNVAAVSINPRVLVFTFALCAITCVFCGLAPALTFRSSNLRQSRQTGQTTSIRSLARSLIVVEIASCAVLLVASGLLLRSFLGTIQVPLGFDPGNTLIVRTSFNRYRYASPDRRHAAEHAIEQSLSALPGVSSVALTTHVPLADERQIGFVIDGGDPNDFHRADNALVSGAYFRLMKIPLLRGRTFSDSDTPAAPLAAVVNETLAKQYWPNTDPLGKGFQWGGRHLTVIGVASDIHVQALDKSVGPQVYNSVYQIESGATTSAVFLIRLQPGASPMRLAASAQTALWSVDRGLPILGFGTLEQVVSGSLAVRRLSLLLVGAFAAVALLLSLIGIYGVQSYAVSQRIQEMGVRLALGAKPTEIAGLVIKEGGRLAVTGVLLGLIAGALSTRYMAHLLFGVKSLDPLTFVAGAALLFAVSVLASYLPARRASRVDPMVALRYE